MAGFNHLKATIPENTVLFEEGQTTKEMYILLAGEVEVSKAGTVLATVNTNGAFLGEMATLLNAPRTATCKTTKKSVFLKVEPENVDTLFKVTPELGYNLSKTLAKRLADMTSKVSDMHENASSRGDGKSGEPKPLPKEELEKAKTEAEKGEEPPVEDLGDTLKFLTRTAVHAEVLRQYFNCLGEKKAISEFADELEIPALLTKLVLMEYEKAGLVKIDGEKAEYLFHEEFVPLAEDWVFEHGLFRQGA